MNIDEFFAVQNKENHHLYNSLFNNKQLNQMFEEDIVSFDSGSRNTKNKCGGLACAMLTNNEAWTFEDDVNLIKTLPLMNSPLPILIIWIVYMVFVLKVGPAFMKTRSAYNMDKIMTLYNAFQVAISAYFVYKGLPMVWRVGLSPKCLHDKEFAIDYFTNFHIYYMIKITELLDTVFFVLRRKFSQITFLHLYHHSYMLLSTWVVLRYDPTLAVLFAGLVNSFVHLIMYAYYGLSAYPKLTKYLWWKKYITTLQLVQFVVISMQLVHQYHFSECPPSIFTAYNGVLHCLLFLGLFSHFYINAYIKPSDVENSISKKIL